MGVIIDLDSYEESGTLPRYCGVNRCIGRVYSLGLPEGWVRRCGRCGHTTHERQVPAPEPELVLVPEPSQPRLVVYRTTGLVELPPEAAAELEAPAPLTLVELEER